MKQNQTGNKTLSFHIDVAKFTCFHAINVKGNLVNSSNSIIITTRKYGTTRGKLWQMRVFYIAYINVFDSSFVQTEKTLVSSLCEITTFCGLKGNNIKEDD